MVALRSARLEGIFGARLEELEASHIEGLADNQVRESFDLEFKRELYDGSDAHRRALATDVAALANTAGGVIVLGVEEDDHARAKAADGVTLSEKEKGRMQKIIASNVAPTPEYDVLAIETSPGSENGFFVIAVPRSPAAPHAVLVNDALRYPKRNGSDTRYLAEPEVADAYRNRFVTAEKQLDRAIKVEKEAAYRVDRDSRCWLVISLVSELAGDLVVDTSSWKAFRERFEGQTSMIGGGSTWSRTSVGRRRLVATGASGTSPLARYLYTELHHDGAGTFAIELPNITPSYIKSGESDGFVDISWMISDEFVVHAVISILGFLARHARDEAAAGGKALVRLSIISPEINGSEVPVSLGDGRGSGNRLGTLFLPRPLEPAERVFSLDSLASEGPSLITATYLLATDLFQSFGFTEAHQVTLNGEIRIRYWSNQFRSTMETWATKAGVTTTEDAFS